MKSYNKGLRIPTRMTVNSSTQGESIEQKIARITTTKEPIKDGAPIIYTPRDEGVGASYNVRSDRFEIAVDAMDKVEKSHRAKRAERAGKPEGKPEGSRDPKDGKPESIQGKSDTDTNKS